MDTYTITNNNQFVSAYVVYVDKEFILLKERDDVVRDMSEHDLSIDYNYNKYFERFMQLNYELTILRLRGWEV